MLTKTLQLVALGFFNRLAGGLFGLIKWTVILCVLLLAFDQIESVITILPQSFTEESITYPFLADLSNFLFDWIFQNKTFSEQEFI